jgi:hypothetical protein
MHVTVGTTDHWYLANAVRYVEAFLKTTKDPHCYQGDPMTPLSMSDRMAITREMPQMADRMIKTAPQGADLKSWR